VAAAARRVAASQLDEPLLDVPLDLDLAWPRGLPATADGGLDALGDQLLADTGDRSQAGPQRGDDFLIKAMVAEGVVGEQEDAGVGKFAGCRLAAGDQLLQRRPLLRRQSDPVLVHGSFPVFGLSSLANSQESGYSFHLPNEDG
jgi:hypothetical protein